VDRAKILQNQNSGCTKETIFRTWEGERRGIKSGKRLLIFSLIAMTSITQTSKTDLWITREAGEQRDHEMNNYQTTIFQV
jgi:hypothetical protein